MSNGSSYGCLDGSCEQFVRSKKMSHETRRTQIGAVFVGSRPCDKSTKTPIDPQASLYQSPTYLTLSLEFVDARLLQSTARSVLG